MLDWLACTLVKVASGVLCRLPPSVAVWLGERLGLVAAWANPARARIGLLNLRAAFDGELAPAQARRIIRACYRQMGSGVVELLRLPVIDRAYCERYVTVEGRAHFEAAVASGKPVLLLTGHFGNWELGSIVAALHGYPIVALARAQNKFPRLYRLLVSYRESKGCTIVHKGGAMKRLITALERRELVGIVGDQASRQGRFVDFFGRPALFAVGPFDLARRKGALIVPAFVHRVRGPFHRLVIEPPIVLDPRAPTDDAVHAGIEAFAAVLERHIRQDPGQWLWMHKRWKHTPARRVLVLSDGKLGHVKQSMAVVDALRHHHPALTHQVAEVRYRSRAARALAMLWSWVAPAGLGACRCLAWTLAPSSASALLSRYADLIVSCGAATTPANLLWSGHSRCRSVVVMKPAPFSARRFDLVIAPKHDGLAHRPNVVETGGALVAPQSEERLRQAMERLRGHPRFRPAAPPPVYPPKAGQRGATDTARQRRAETGGGVPPVSPVVAVFIGGDTPHHALSPSFAEALVRQVQLACEAIDGRCLVTTSRRTSPTVERLVEDRLSRDPRCRLALIATRDPIDGTMDGMLGAADVAVVTGESISMVSEACASGRRVIVVEPPLARMVSSGPIRHQRFLRQLAQEGHVTCAMLPELSLAIQRLVKSRQPARRLEDFEAVRAAVAKLL